jgi:hypothetical protein
MREKTKRKKKEIPAGSKFGNYFLAKDKTMKSGFAIRQRVTLPDGEMTYPRYDAKKYSHFNNKEELENLVLRLNHRTKEREAELRAIKNIKTKLAFLPPGKMEEFRLDFYARYTNSREQNYYYKTCLRKYFIDFFVTTLGLVDPQQWHRHQSKWGHALTQFAIDSDHDYSARERKRLRIFKEDENLRSPKTIKEIIGLANGFMKWLHENLAGEVSLYKFKPLTDAQKAKYETAYGLTNREERKPQYISDTHWKVIEKNLPKEIAPYIKLGYYYGLRRSETLAIFSGDLTSTHIHIRRQLIAINGGEFQYNHPKDYEERKVPHWYLTEQEARELIDESMKYIVAPDTLGAEWKIFMDELNLSKKYKLHDLRHTWITRSIRAHSLIDTQLAAGHSKPETTLGYQRDDRELNDTPSTLTPARKPERRPRKAA